MTWWSCTRAGFSPMARSATSSAGSGGADLRDAFNRLTGAADQNEPEAVK